MPLLCDLDYSEERHDAMIATIRQRGSVEIAEVIDAVVDGYAALYDIGPDAINDGLCEDFAADVATLVPGARPQWADDMDDAPEGAHCVVVYAGRYYDAQCSQGCDAVGALPFFTDARAAHAAPRLRATL